MATEKIQVKVPRPKHRAGVLPTKVERNKKKYRRQEKHPDPLDKISQN